MRIRAGSYVHVMGVMELGVKNLVQSHEIGRQNSHWE